MANKTKKTRVMKKETILGRVKKMTDMRDKILKELDKDINSYHVKLMRGNDKTGVNCYTVSLIPIADCSNCSGCAFGGCYDIQNVCWKPSVQKQRAINSAIHKVNIGKFWEEANLQIKALFIEELRINVGGDLLEEDFIFMKWLAMENPTCHFLFFTKNYDGINSFIDHCGDFPINVHPVMSPWLGMEFNNPHNLPCAHVLWADGRTTAPDFAAKFCNGNCSECFHHFKYGDKVNSGCWGMEKGDHVIFLAH